MASLIRRLCLTSAAGFWDLGHKVFRSTPESFPARFIPGDAFDESFLESGPIADSFTLSTISKLDIASLTSLTPLRGKLSAIYNANLFHLFDEEKQEILAKKLASLLSPEPGSLIFGAHLAKTGSKGTVNATIKHQTVQKIDVFCHCPESWNDLWEGIFGAGNVEVTTLMSRLDLKDLEFSGDSDNFMIWSVRHL